MQVHDALDSLIAVDDDDEVILRRSRTNSASAAGVSRRMVTGLRVITSPALRSSRLVVPVI